MDIEQRAEQLASALKQGNTHDATEILRLEVYRDKHRTPEACTVIAMAEELAPGAPDQIKINSGTVTIVDRNHHHKDGFVGKLVSSGCDAPPPCNDKLKPCPGRAGSSYDNEPGYTPRTAGSDNPAGKDIEWDKLMRPTKLEELAAADQKQADWLYSHSPAGAMPNGESEGKAMVLPGTRIGDFFSRLDNEIWTGKVIDSERGDLVNKVFGLKLIHANVSRGTSWQDGKESIIIDYKGTSAVAGFLRDEIREVQPGLYLGKAYVRLPFGNHMPALYFALDFNKDKPAT
jgi:hypothetical protein